MSDLLCVDNKFPEEFMQAYIKYGVKIPEEGQLYTLRQLVNTTQGMGVLLNEINNPPTPIKHPMGVTGEAEVCWAIRRFRHLDMSEFTEEELRIMIKEQQKVEKL